MEAWAVSPRGAGWLFGAKITQEVRDKWYVLVYHAFDNVFANGVSQFNHVNSISLIARAHQLVQEGFKYMFAPENSLVTVWSAPNYCYRCGNVASVMEVRDGGQVDAESFKIFDAGEAFTGYESNQKCAETLCAAVAGQDRMPPNRFNPPASVSAEECSTRKVLSLVPAIFLVISGFLVSICRCITSSSVLFAQELVACPN